MKTNFNLERILNVVADHYQIDKKNILSLSRKTNYVVPRQVYMYMANEHTEKTLEEISRYVNRNHATAIYSIAKIKVEKELYKELKEDLTEINGKLASHIIPFDIDLLALTINYTNSFIL